MRKHIELVVWRRGTGVVLVVSMSVVVVVTRVHLVIVNAGIFSINSILRVD